jgi:hypothetical protein
MLKTRVPLTHFFSNASRCAIAARMNSILRRALYGSVRNIFRIEIVNRRTDISLYARRQRLRVIQIETFFDVLPLVMGRVRTIANLPNQHICLQHKNFYQSSSCIVAMAAKTSKRKR